MLRSFLLAIRNRLRPTRSTGARGEDLAARHLSRAGYRILGRNLPLRFTEIDILAEAPDRETIVVVEVKTRSRPSESASVSQSHSAERAVDEHKRHLLIKATRHLAAANRWYGRPLRVDVIAVELASDPSQTLLRHYPDAVQESRQPDQPSTAP